MFCFCNTLTNCANRFYMSITLLYFWFFEVAVVSAFKKWWANYLAEGNSQRHVYCKLSVIYMYAWKSESLENFRIFQLRFELLLENWHRSRKSFLQYTISGLAVHLFDTCQTKPIRE